MWVKDISSENAREKKMKAGKSLRSKLNNEDTLRPYERITTPLNQKTSPTRLKTNPLQEREITTRATQYGSRSCQQCDHCNIWKSDDDDDDDDEDEDGDGGGDDDDNADDNDDVVTRDGEIR